MSNILVTGSQGFIGRALTARLKNSGFRVLEFNTSEGNIAQQGSLNLYIDEPINHTFHLSAKTFIPDSWESPIDFFHTNVIGTSCILDFCKTKKSPLTYISTYVYGNPERLPQAEEDPVSINNPYTLSKYLAEQICQFYASNFDMKITVFRPFNVYGIGQSQKFLIPEILHQAMHENAIKVKDLSPRRDYIYLEDLIDALLCTINPASKFALYNIGSGRSLSVKEVAETILDVLNMKKQIISENKERKNEVIDTVADISRARKELGWNPHHSFRDGIAKIIENMQKSST
ncbi:MAG: NAD-dependent epimerase/dehydratase family protein [Candidatus Xenobiia bacterium LiM19]